MKVRITRKLLFDYTLVTLGCFLTAISIVSFMLPNNIIAGGASGLAIIVYRLTGLSVGLQMLLYNLILFILGFLLLGVSFGFKSIYASLILSLMVELLQKSAFPWFDASTMQDGYLLVSIYGGVTAGIGMGMVLWRGASTGGTDIVAMIMNKYLHITTGTGLLLTDSLITLMAVIIFGPVVAMYGIITIFITSKAIDGIIEGIGNTRTAFIISESHEIIKQRILDEMERGVTILNAFGGFTGDKRPVLMVSIRRREIGELRSIVKSEDNKSFVILVNNSEVFGEGFKNIR